jgi:CHRD domain/PEP-CTERM motif
VEEEFMLKRLLVVALLALSYASAAQAAPILYTSVSTGANEPVPNNSPAMSFDTVIYDPVARTLDVNTVFQGLTSASNGAHIHCCTMEPFTGTAGVATPTPAFPGFPLPATSGTYDGTPLNLALATSWNAPFLAMFGGDTQAAENAFAAGLASGRTYFQIHTANFPGGEIRGFLQPQQVPEPASLSLLGLGLGIAAARRRLQNRRKN